MTLNTFPFRVLALTMLAACGQSATDPSITGSPEVARLEQAGPPGALPGTCWGKTVTPAVIETRTEQKLVRPAKQSDDGTVIRPAKYKTETQQVIVSERQTNWFETPCDSVLTVEFISSLQRALAARDLYGGAISGELDARTRAAIRRYQRAAGPNSAILSLASARSLGLVAVQRDGG